MSNLQKILLDLAILKAIADHAEKAITRRKADLKTEVGGRMGAAAAMLPDGSEAATVSITKPSPGKRGGEPYVANPQAFLQWCKEHRPDAILESVHGASQQAILADVKETGDLPDGVALTEPTGPSGGGVVQVRQSEEQRLALIHQYHAGRINLPDVLPEIEED